MTKHLKKNMYPNFLRWVIRHLTNKPLFVYCKFKWLMKTVTLVS